MGFLWTYVLGPVLVLLPRRWREVLGSGEVHWGRAGVLSGLLEGVGGIVALGYWYSYGFSRMVDTGVATALRGDLGPGVTDQEVGGVSYVVIMTHPITWLLAFFVVEGAVRLCAAAFAEPVGTLPLVLVDWAAGMFRPRDERATETLKRNAGSFAGAIKEKVMLAKARDVEDELNYRKNGADEILEIRASRKKEEWVAPKVVRVDETYYRLDETGVGAGARPFWYRLKRLPAGVPGRKVILYRTPQGG